ncbi:MAG: MxaS protein [Methylocystis sp.]|nr:MAG: MxaS protein [Methylocystis sp.]
MKTPAEILYRPHGRFRSNHTGAHVSSEVGGFGVFRDQAPFLRHPDARRIDLRSTLRDPFGETHVRRFEQRSAIDVYAIVDLSASMAFVGAVDRFAVACEICAALAFSAPRIGDRFGLIAGGDCLREDQFLPATRSRGAALRAVERLQSIRPAGAHSDSLVDAATRLGAGRKLVLLISDFRWALRQIQHVFGALALHDVLPVTLVDSVELDPPRWGLLELQDPETACRRLLVMRPALRDRWLETEAKRREELIRLAAGRVRPPIFIEDRFSPLSLSSRLMAA